MIQLNLDKIESVRHMINEGEQFIGEGRGSQLCNMFHGNFYLKFADNQYKTFEQDLVEDPKEEPVHLSYDDEPELDPEVAAQKIERLQYDISNLMTPICEYVDQKLIDLS